MVLDEAGGAPEGLAELYRLTEDQQVLAVIDQYLGQLFDKLERPDGLWDRLYWPDTGAVTSSEPVARGAGWTMMGLLAAYRATADAGYLDRANRLADHLLQWQRDDGAWSHQFRCPVEDVGYSTKGTALWSVLLYRLHEQTHDRRHLEAARQALDWCRQRLRRDEREEGHGGIIGVGPSSGITYRPWFRLSCTYTTAFLAQALIYELELQRAEK